MTIKIPVQIPYEINSLKIVEFVVTPLTFSDYVAVVKKALDDDTETASVNVLIRRGRFMKQVEAITDTGKVVRFDGLSLMQLPSQLARELNKSFDTGIEVAGEVTKKGDGISASIVYKLGTPITAQGSSITELEFLAPCFGDIEDVMIETQPLFQTMALIEKTAKPIGMLAIPSWAISKISITDGLLINQLVLPSFLD